MLKSFFLQCLYWMKNGTIAVKIKSSFYLALMGSPVAYILEQITKWSNENVIYIAFVLGAITIDHILGTIVHLFIKRDFTFVKNIVGLLVKIGLVIAVQVIINGLDHIAGETLISGYLAVVGQLMVFLYPAGSALINSSVITKGVFPPTSFIDRFKHFNKNLDPHALTGDTHKPNDEDYVDR